MGLRKIIGMLFLAAQCVSMAIARFVPEKFFCWAPYDEHTSLNTRVWLKDQELDRKQIDQRYRYFLNGWEPRAIHNVFDIVEQYETTYGAGDSAQVLIQYSTNGHPHKKWHFPNPTK